MKDFFLQDLFTRNKAVTTWRVVGTVVINSPRIILRYFCSHVSLREKKNDRYVDGSFWRQ